MRLSRPGCASVLSWRCLRGYACVLLIAMLAGPLARADLPRVASLNICTDLWLLTLADPEQIASLTFLAADPASSFLADQARDYPLNRGRAEDIIVQDVDLVLAGRFAATQTQRLLKRLDYDVHVFDLVDSVETMLAQVRQIGALIGQPERAERWVAQAQRRLRASRRRLDDAPAALVYGANGFVPGAQTLTGAALNHSGWRNTAADAGVQYYGHIDLERLLRLQPDALILSPQQQGERSLAQRLTRHPAIRAGVSAQRLHIPGNWWGCGGEGWLRAVEALARARDNLTTLARYP